jgi:nucleoside-diphosphate-sugar epimerase
MAEAVAQHCAPSVPVQIARQPVPGQPGERYVPSTHEVRTELGLRETVDLREAVQKTIRWHRNRSDNQ